MNKVTYYVLEDVGEFEVEMEIIGDHLTFEEASELCDARIYDGSADVHLCVNY